MGWASANPIFDETIREAIYNDVEGRALYCIASALIAQLQNGDWDTEDESLEQFRDQPEVIRAFKDAGVLIPCICTCCVHETDQ